jgi:hypothetical protein
MIKESHFKIITTSFVIIAAFLSIFLFFKQVDISLWFHQNQPVYYHNQSIQTAFQEPGKPAELIADYLGQFMQSNITGSFILTVLMSCWVVSFIIIIGTFAPSNRSLSLIILSVVPFLIAHGYYNFPLSITVSYVFAALTACLMIPVINHYKLTITGIFYTLFCVLTYLFWGGSGLLLITVISSGLFLAHKKYAHLLLLIIPLILPMICLIFYSDMSLKSAYWGEFMPDRYHFAPWSIKVLPALVFIIILILILFQRIIHRTVRWYLSLSIHMVILIIGLPLVYSYSYHESRKDKILIDKLAANEEWIELLKTAKHIDLTKESEVQFQVNRALCHQGVLLDKLFTYPQYFGVDGLFLDKVTAGTIALPTSDLYYDLSFFNGSRHWANEAFIIYGAQPRILKRLISCYIISKQFELASRYLSLLELSSQHKDWALKMRNCLNDGNCLNNSTDFSSGIKNREFPDMFEAINYPRANLYLLSSGAPINKMAVEYSVAYDLLKHDLKNIIDDLKLMKAVGVQKLPKPVQEAILIYMLKERDFHVDLQGFSIDIDVQKDFHTFNQIFASVKGDKARAIGLHYQFKDTYWYYNLYKSPITNGRKIKGKQVG